MRRLNSEGIDRADLVRGLRNEDTVRRARTRNQCLLCRGKPVNAAGLCEGCSANLTNEEHEAARPWIEGLK